MRTQNKSTIAYMFRNFWKLVYVTLPVSVLIAFFLHPSHETALFAATVRGDITMDNYMIALSDAFTVLRWGRYWWVALCAVVLLSYAMCVMVVKLDRHMRMGKMPALPVRRAFGIFPQMLGYIAVWVCLSELYKLIIVGIAYMLKFIPSATAIVCITMALVLVARTFVAYLFGLLLLTFPLKYSENYRFNIAMAYSARTMSTKRLQLVGLSLAYTLGRVAVQALAYLLQPYRLYVVLYAVVLTLMLMFVPGFAFKKYYDDVGGERRDISELLFH